MKKNKVILCLLLILGLFYFNLENVDAMVICTRSPEDNCEKRTYSENENGDNKGFSFTLGVYHWKNNGSDFENNEDIFSFDECSYKTDPTHCNSKHYKFDTGSSGIYIEVDSTQNVFPIAICGFPDYNFRPLNKILADPTVNPRNYIYFTEEEIETAIEDGYCTQENVYYQDGINDTYDNGSSDLSTCEEHKVIATIESDTDMTGAYILADTHQEGPIYVCDLNMTKDDNKLYYHDKSNTVGCVGRNYRLSCSKDSNGKYSCELWTCKEQELNSDIKNCTLTNKSNSKEKLVFSYSLKKDSEGGYPILGMKVNGNPASYIIDGYQDRYAESKTCPTYILHMGNTSGVSGTSEEYYVVLPTKSLRDMWVDEHESDPILNEYTVSLEDNSNNNSDSDINWEDQVEVNCEGIIGEEMLDFINKIFTWIKIIAPIIVVIMGSVEFAGAILQDDKDAMKKAANKFIKRLIVAVAIFLIPTLMEFLLNIFNEFSRHSADICGIGE